MRYKFFATSLKAWRAMFEGIENAQKSIYLEMYIFVNDTVQYDFLALLKKKANAGMRVKIVLDSLGSADLSKNAIAELRASGAEVLFQSYFFHRAHRKVLIVDESIAFIGGVNISQQFRLWNDLVIEIKGKRLLKHISSSFAKVYKECGGKDPELLAQDKKIILNQARTWLVEHFPIGKKFNLKKIYKEHLKEAKENVIFVTPYFIPRRWLIVALHQAVLRGVKVEVLVPKVTNHFFANRVGYFFMYKLSKLGINFLLQPKMNHAKVMLIDGKEGIVGSQNLDFLSFDFNSEIGVFLKDMQAVKKLALVVQKWKEQAFLFETKKYKPTWLDHIISSLIRIFARIM